MYHLPMLSITSQLIHLYVALYLYLWIRGVEANGLVPDAEALLTQRYRYKATHISDCAQGVLPRTLSSPAHLETSVLKEPPCIVTQLLVQQSCMCIGFTVLIELGSCCHAVACTVSCACVVFTVLIWLGSSCLMTD